MQRSALTYALLAVLLWSTVASAFKLTLRYLTVPDLLLIASGTSVLVLLLIALGTGKWVQLKQLTRRQLMMSMLLGFLNPFLYYLVLFHAYDLLAAQQAQSINYSWAITLSLLAALVLKQPLSFSDLLGLFIAYLGVVLIATQGDFTRLSGANLNGVLLALLSTLIWAAYWLLAMKNNSDPLILLLLNFSFGFLFILVFHLLSSEPKAIHLNGFLGALYVGVFEMSLTFYLWLKALQLSHNTAKISTLIFLSPFLSLVFIHFLVGEAITLSTLSGLIIIITGILIQRRATQ